MSGFEALSVASSIIQIVDFGTRVLKRLYDYQTQLGALPKALRNVKIRLPVLIDALRNTKRAVNARRLSEESAEALNGIVKGCEEQIRALDEILDKCSVGEEVSKVRRGWKALESLQLDGKVEEICKVLDVYKGDLTFYWASYDAFGGAECKFSDSLRIFLNLHILELFLIYGN